jgi:hypothetical protein
MRDGHKTALHIATLNTVEISQLKRQHLSRITALSLTFLIDAKRG